MPDKRYLVDFKGSALTDGVRAALAAAGITLVGGTGGGTIAPGGELPEPNHQYVWVNAPE